MVISIQKKKKKKKTTSYGLINRSDATERTGFDSKEKSPVSIMVALGTTRYGLTPTDVFLFF